jgi:uncharacterized membrane protein HdeD (DUF308 family)
MSQEPAIPQVSVTGLHLIGAEDLQKRWGLFVLMGFLMIVLGSIAIGSAVTMTLVTMVFFGWLMIAGGILQTAHGFTCKMWSGFFVDLFAGLLSTVVGFLMITNPGETAITLTLVIAMFLIVGGLFRIVTAAAVQYQNWMMLYLHGAVNLLLGFAILRQWPISGLWVIGLFIGIDMIFNGVSLIMLGMMAKKLPGSQTPA